MNDRELQACKTARTLSSMAALTAVIATLILSRVLDVQSMQWQVVVATVALAAGIPHGALDHLVARPVGNGSTMSGFVVRYVLTAIVALVAILLFNVIGFVFVLVMSAMHFGAGDAAFVAETNKRIAAPTKHRALLYAVPAGILPIVVPLTKSTSENALNEINTNIVRWHGGFDSALLIATALISLAAFIALLATKRYRDAIDIVLLTLLGVVAPPLIAFAVYFGCWHAMRHTARLTLSLPLTKQNLSEGKLNKAFLNAVIPGLPALVGTFAVAGGLALSGKDFTDEFFWMALVVVWALTVPHMAVTAKLDKAALA
jgi:Brp/Blh family beta-carotene 15,15'-monooxygenase